MARKKKTNNNNKEKEEKEGGGSSRGNEVTVGDSVYVNAIFSAQPAQGQALRDAAARDLVALAVAVTYGHVGKEDRTPATYATSQTAPVSARNSVY